VSGKARDARRAVRPSADIDALLSSGEVARRSGLSGRAVHRAIDRRKLRASRLCSRIRIRAVDVEAWVEENQIEPSSNRARFSRPSPLRSAHGLRRVRTMRLLAISTARWSH
jgi:excisionase family DNA binding protein